MSKSLGDNACALLCVAAATTAPLLFGLAIGAAGPSMTTFEGKQKTAAGEEVFHTDAGYLFNDFNGPWFAALLSVGAMIGALMGGQLAERIGRKWTIILMAPVYAVATLLTLFAVNQYMVLASRVVSGFAVGVNSAAAPVYIAEIAPDHLRGALGACNQLMICLGICLAWCFSLYEIELVDGNNKANKIWFDWKLFNWIMMAPIALMALGMLLVPETPRWLASKGRLTEAKRVLSRIRGGKASSAEMESLDNTAIKSAEGSSRGQGVSMSDLAGCKRQLIIAMVLQVFQQFSGINGVMNYMGSMYAQAGLDSRRWSVILTFTQFAVTLVACLLIDRFGRRVLLTAGASGLAAGLAIMAAVMFCIEHKKMKSSALEFGFIAGSLTFMTFFSIGVGAIPWLILGELFNDKVRGTAASIASAVNWTGSFIITVTCKPLFESIHMYGLMIIYFVFAVLMAVFTLTCVPETKGKSMEQIEAIFNKNSSKTSQQDDVATTA